MSILTGRLTKYLFNERKQLKLALRVEKEAEYAAFYHFEYMSRKKFVKHALTYEC
jgi:hypothetical protein